MKRSLKNFNPELVAQSELGMWQSYYNHQFIKLFFKLLRFFNTLFHLNLFQALPPAFYATYAAAVFRLNKGKENENINARVLNALTHFYKSISKNSIESFDFVEVAKLEYKWWLIDRYPERYDLPAKDALANTMAKMHNISQEKCLEYAQYRDQALGIQDKFEHGEEKIINWEEIGVLLRKSYKSLYDAVQ